MTNTCALCGRPIFMSGICSNCWKEWTITGAIPIQQIEWLRQFIPYHRHFERKYYRHYEIPLTLLDE